MSFFLTTAAASFRRGGESLPLPMPASVTNLNLSNVTETGMTVSWDAVANAEDYRLQYREQGTSSWIILSWSTQRSYDFSSLKAGTTYEFKVTSRNATGTTAGTVNTQSTEVSEDVVVPVSSYPLTEVSGQAIDVVSAGINMDVYGSMVRTGAHYEFNGSNAYLRTPVGEPDQAHNFSAGNGNDHPFTIRASIAVGSLGQNSWFIGRRSAPETGEYQIYFWGGDIYIQLIEQNVFANKIDQRARYRDYITSGVFARFAIVYDGSKTAAGVKFYINGAEIPLTTHGLTSYGGMTTTTDTAHDTHIGAPQFNTSYRFNGKMKDIHIGRGAMTAAEIQEDYSNAIL